MSEKTLGQVGYEAYVLCEYSNEEHVDRWPPGDVNGWQAAAEAVVAAAEHPDWHDHYERMKAVIEAARVLARASWKDGAPYAELEKLEAAIEVLEAAEKGE